MSSDIDLITSGSVWKKLRGQKAGSPVKVLWFTNTELKASLQTKYPPQVVFFTTSGVVVSRDVDSFLDNYEFYNVDPELEYRLDNLMVYSESDNDEDSESLTIQETSRSEISEKTKSFADSLLEPENELNQLSEEKSSTKVFAEFSYLQDPYAQSDSVLSEKSLKDAFVAYSQEPDHLYENIHHKLLFKLESDVSIESLIRTFKPDDSFNTVDYFCIMTKDSRDIFQWNDYIGVFPEFNVHGLYASVMLRENLTRVNTDSDIANEEHNNEEYEKENNVSTASVNQISEKTDIVSEVPDTQLYSETEIASAETIQANTLQSINDDVYKLPNLPLKDTSSDVSQIIPDVNVVPSMIPIALAPTQTSVTQINVQVNDTAKPGSVSE